MAKYNHKENTASLFTNNKTDATKKQPDFTGSGNFKGTEFTFAAWENPDYKEGENKPKLNIKFTPK